MSVVKELIQKRTEFYTKKAKNVSIGNVNDIDKKYRIKALYIQSRTEMDVYTNMDILDRVINESKRKNDMF